MSDQNPTPDKRRWLLFVCLLAAVVHGLFYIGQPPNTALSPDEAEYAALGIRLAEAGELRLPTGEAAKRMPLYPACIAVLYHWQGADLWRNAALGYQALLAWCTAIIIALTAAHLADGRAGWIAGTVASFYAPFLLLQTQLLTETLLIFLILLALLLYVAIFIQAPSAAGRWAGLAGVGLLLGVAVLTRANALLFAVPFAADALFRAGSRSQRVLRVMLILIPVAACSVAWCARNSRAAGAFTLSTSGGLNFYLGHNAGYAGDPGLGGDTDYEAFDSLRREQGLTEAEADRRLYQSGYDFIAANPGTTAVNIGRKLAVWLRPTITVSAPSLLLLILGTIVVSGRRKGRAYRLTGRRRLLYRLASAAAWPCLAVWILVLLDTNRPWTTPMFVVPIGLVALLLLGGKQRVRGLLVGLFACQLFVAVAYIPLSRLRWVVDGILIVAIGVGLSRLCSWLYEEATEPADAPSPRSSSPKPGAT